MTLFSLYMIYAAFSEHPVSFNASQGSTVTFHCEVNESGNIILFWLVNDEIFNSVTNRNRSISLMTFDNRISTLTIEAHIWNNNTEIQCRFRLLQSTSVNCQSETVTCSEKAILMIQGSYCNMYYTIMYCNNKDSD